ncbi:MAG: transposase [Bacteroidaceae bacterium]|nr:transposase [Bacteroidaceae bacterium]
MATNLDKIHEMYNLLNDNNHVTHDILSNFGRFGLAQTLRRLKMEKQQGVSAVQIIMLLCLIRINGESVFGVYRKNFHDLLSTGKNCYYRMLNRESMDWRTLLLRMAVRFLAILKKENAEETRQPKCYIIDDTTLEKTGISIEGISRVFDHVSHKYVLGFKLNLLAFFDGRSTIPVDFSLHREKGSEGNYGLSDEELSQQYSKKRSKDNADHLRFKELDSKKSDTAIEMMKRAWKAGIRATYALCDSWYTSEKFIHDVRTIGNGSVHFLGMGKMGKQRYRVRGFLENAYELVARYERTKTKSCHKYNCKYFCVTGLMGKEVVRIFFVKYGMNQNWNILITSDITMNFEKCFETYQIRWNIEVLNKESKQYLGLGTYQGRDFDGQVADCTLCYMTYLVMAVDKRLNEYETYGALFEQQREDLMALTLWKRILDIIMRIMKALSELIGVSAEELVNTLIRDEKTLAKYEVMLKALEEYEKVA